MALDAVTIVGLVLGVLGLFGITLMYDLTKKVGNLLVRFDQDVGALVTHAMIDASKSLVKACDAGTEWRMQRDYL